MLFFARAYPKRTAIMLGCLVLAALAEGIGLSSMMPLLGIAARLGLGVETQGPGPRSDSALERIVTNALATVGAEPSIGLLLVLIVSGIALKSVMLLMAEKQVGYTVAQVATDLRLALIRNLLAARWEYYVRQPVGALANSFATEAARAAMAYNRGAEICMLGIQALLYLALAASVSVPVVFGATGAGIGIALGLKHLVRRTRKAGAKQTELLRSLLGQLTDVLFSVKPIKAMAREGLVGPLLEEETQRLNLAMRREVLSKSKLKALQEPLVVSALALGLYFALARWGLPLDAVVLLALLFTRTLNCLNKVQKEYQAMVASESAFWSLQRTIEGSTVQAEILSGSIPAKLTREVTLRQVSFAYGERSVLRDASLRIPVGELTLLVGASGAGKTSILDLVIGLVRPQSGEVWIDDCPLSEVDLKSWRTMVGYVAQETLLLHESILVNVTLGDKAVTAKEVEQALRDAGIWEFVSALPNGMSTLVGERGSGVSGGQRQRIAIARALVRKPQLLILDEATASLDPESEAAVCATVQRLRGRVTLLAISHQAALLEAADRAYRIENGAVQLIRERGVAGQSVHVA